jgi:hypothetical protein
MPRGHIVCGQFVPTIVHAYDNKSYFFARLIAHRHRAKRFLTKPAGPNPGLAFPYCPDTVCFSAENLSALRSRRRLRTGRLHFIPNRVAFPAPDSARIATLRTLIGPGDVLLRICRIGEYHRRSIEQTLALARLMRTEGIHVRAVIVGAPDSSPALESLRARAEAGDLFITGSLYTVDSAALLDIASYVVGTGRGVVEAAMRERLVFVPLVDADVPVLVTPSNWRTLSLANFSARTPSMRGTGPAGLSPLRELLDAPRRRESFVSQLSNVLSSAYGPSEIPVKYKELYSNDQRTGVIEPFDCLVNSGSFLSHIYGGGGTGTGTERDTRGATGDEAGAVAGTAGRRSSRRLLGLAPTLAYRRRFGCSRVVSLSRPGLRRPARVRRGCESSA